MGDAAVGKTSLVQRFIQQKFERQYFIAMGFERYTRFESIHGATVCYSLWDIASEDKIRVMRKIVYQGSVGVLICIDLTPQTSCENATNWIHNAKAGAP
ncbi:MAG: hypothetical protein IH840_11455 [Candidatus Heimdallarchaeota archaeon]|nr:hypothetical protein [Candidatus Heimdallarchaeota archaeon]